MHIAHHPIFFALSVLVACLGSWTALDLFRRVRAHTGMWRGAWLAASGIAMGLSIWSMHFIAILGFDPGSEVRYEIGQTMVSLLLAVFVTTLAFVFVNDRSPRTLFAAGTFMGVGICTMHYVGMSALQTSATIANDPLYVVLAGGIAITASTGALMAARRDRTLLQRAIAAIVLGAAIVGMHYTAMLGVTLLPGSTTNGVIASGVDSITLAIGIAVATAMILFLALIAALSDRRFEALAAREAMRSEQRLRAIMEHLPFGIFVAARPSGEIQFANAEAEALLRHPLTGATVWNAHGNFGAVHADGRLLAPEEHALHKAMLEGRRIGPRIQPYRRGDGAIVQLEVTAAPMASSIEGSQLAVVAFQDVTAKLGAEQEARQAMTLRDSEQRFRLIAEHAPVMLWISDAAGAHVYGNQALRDFCGLNEDADGHWLNNLDAADRDAFALHFASAAREKRGFSAEAWCRGADGSPRIVRINARARFNDQGAFAGLIGVNVDMTEIRQAQTELLRMNEVLEERVDAALEEKARAQQELMHAQRLESLGRLTGGVAHDFNNLLTVVIGALDIILRHPENAARRTKLGEAALAAAKRGERLTAQLLAFARRQPLRTEPCDLNALIRQGEPLMQRAVGDSLVLHLRLGEPAALVQIDPAQFESALLNLIVNAVDATPAGGTIAIETTVHEVARSELLEIASGRYLCVRVSDTGEGMAPDVVTHIFEPFFTTKPPGQGTGLGLSQVYGFVRQSGGTVRVQSAPGIGTTFELFLPVLDESVQPSLAQEAGRPRGQRALRVLLTEDDNSVAVITETMLKNLGHEVTRTADADQAIETLKSERALDILISDIAMPGAMNGVELARAASRLRPQLKILLISGYAGESLDEELAQGGWPFLKKPYLEHDLGAAIDTLFKETAR